MASNISAAACSNGSAVRLGPQELSAIVEGKLLRKVLPMARKQLSQNKLGKVPCSAALSPALAGQRKCAKWASLYQAEVPAGLDSPAIESRVICNNGSFIYPAQLLPKQSWDGHEPAMNMFGAGWIWQRCETAASPVSGPPAGCTHWQLLGRAAQEILKLLGA